MKLNIVFQYVTLLDSHFNIELFKPQRKHNKSCDYFTIKIFLQFYRGHYENMSRENKNNSNLVRKKIWYQLDWSQKLSIVTHLGRD